MLSTKQIPSSILLYWFSLNSWGMDFVLPGGNNNFIVIIHTLGPFGVDIITKGVEGVATDHKCLPALWYWGVLPYQGHSQVKDTDKSLE